MVQAVEEGGIRGRVTALLRGLPELLLGRVAVAHANAEQAVSEFLGRIREISCTGIHNTSGVDQPECADKSRHAALSIQGDDVPHMKEGRS